MLVEFAHRGICPDLILFADTGGEKPETYAYLPTIQEFLSQVGFPAVTTVRYPELFKPLAARLAARTLRESSRQSAVDVTSAPNTTTQSDIGVSDLRAQA
jgi:hypothetical protein